MERGQLLPREYNEQWAYRPQVDFIDGDSNAAAEKVEGDGCPIGYTLNDILCGEIQSFMSLFALFISFIFIYAQQHLNFTIFVARIRNKES